MEWLLRLRLSVIILLLGLAVGGVGTLVSARVPLWGIALLVFGAAMLFLAVPRLPHAFSQEDLVKELEDMKLAVGEFQAMKEELVQLHQEIEDMGILKQEQITEMDQRFQVLRQKISPEVVKTLRELLFSEQRRTLSVIVVMLLLAGFAAAGFVPTLGRWLF